MPRRRRRATRPRAGCPPAAGSPENRWKGHGALFGQPRIRGAPSGGMLGNTNNKTVDRPFPLHVSHDWGDTQRVHALAPADAEPRGAHPRQLHRGAARHRQLHRALAAAADRRTCGSPARPRPKARPRRASARSTLLADWNGEMNEHLPEPLIYAAWLRACRTGSSVTSWARWPMNSPIPTRSSSNGSTATSMGRGGLVRRDPVDRRRGNLHRHRPAGARRRAGLGPRRYGTALESLRWGDAHEADARPPGAGRCAACCAIS